MIDERIDAVIALAGDTLLPHEVAIRRTGDPAEATVTLTLWRDHGGKRYERSHRWSVWLMSGRLATARTVATMVDEIDDAAFGPKETP